MRAVNAAIAVAVFTCSFVAAVASPVAAGETSTYTPPVDAPVADPFREPDGPYGPGNRGIEYDTVPGTVVRSIGPGEVVFAGPVAGALHVTVLHPDGLRSSYSFLASVSVRRGGQRVAAQAIVGAAGERLHLGVRRGDDYLDPAPLVAGRTEVRVRLVPQGVDDGSRLSEVAALTGVVRERGGLGERAVSWLVDRGRDVVDATLIHLDPRRHPVVLLARAARDLSIALLGPTRPCTAAETNVPRPRVRRVAVLVGGLGSTSDDAAIDDVDATGLGYQRGDVVRFSYAGGRTPDATDRIDVAASRYRARDTQNDLSAMARRLADLILRVAEDAPDATIDVIGHSQGGVLARLAVVDLERRGRLPAAVDVVATLGAPHAGAPLAGSLAAMRTTLLGDAALEAIGRLPGVGLDPDGPSPAQLAPGSPALTDSPLPPAVRAVAIAARTDLVVPAPAARLGGATNVVVPVDGVRAHDALPGASATQRELALALAGLPPGCESRWDRVLDVAAGTAINGVEGTLEGFLFAG